MRRTSCQVHHPAAQLRVLVGYDATQTKERSLSNIHFARGARHKMRVPGHQNKPWCFGGLACGECLNQLYQADTTQFPRLPKFFAGRSFIAGGVKAPQVDNSPPPRRGLPHVTYQALDVLATSWANLIVRGINLPETITGPNHNRVVTPLREQCRNFHGSARPVGCASAGEKQPSLRMFRDSSGG